MEDKQVHFRVTIVIWEIIGGVKLYFDGKEFGEFLGIFIFVGSSSIGIIV